MSSYLLSSRNALSKGRHLPRWVLLPLTFVTAGVAVLVMLHAAATGSALPAEEPLVAPAAVAPRGDTTVPSAESVLLRAGAVEGEHDAPTF